MRVVNRSTLHVPSFVLVIFVPLQHNYLHITSCINILGCLMVIFKLRDCAIVPKSYGLISLYVLQPTLSVISSVSSISLCLQITSVSHKLNTPSIGSAGSVGDVQSQCIRFHLTHGPYC